MSFQALHTDRREFLKVTIAAGGALVIGGAITPPVAGAGSDRMPVSAEDGTFAPNAWLSVAPNDRITIMIHHSEMGQGIMTALAMIVAEELEADWSKIRAEHAPVRAVYKNPAFGVQGTGGSTSVSTSWDILRRAGATARELFLAAAAETWGVPKEECRAKNSAVIHTQSGKTLRYGELIQTASRLSPQDDPPLKKPEDFALIGKSIGRLDSDEKARGKAVFGTDVALKGLLTATMVHPPTIGGRLVSLDPSSAKEMPGVKHVIPIASGIAVVADTFWHAVKGARAVTAQWDEGPLASFSTEGLRDRWRGMIQQEGRRVREEGWVDKAFSESPRVIEAEYELPYEAHACPEPMNCTADVRKDRCDIWVPTQNQGGTREIAAAITGLDLDAVKVHTTFLGGGFGRRGDADFVAEAVTISREIGAPVKLIWTREEDIRNDHFRPASYHVIRAALNEDNKPTALSHKQVAPSDMDMTVETMAPAAMPEWLPRKLKNMTATVAVPIVKYFAAAESATGGATSIDYAFEHFRTEYIKDDPGIPAGPWRSVANSRNAFVVESFMDEIAAAAGKDPVQLRLELLRDSPKRKAVLEMAADKAGWDRPALEGVHRGVAVHQFHDTPAAMVVEVSVSDDGLVTVHRVVCAVHCGIVINPKIVEAQMIGGIAFGLSAALKSSITFRNGRAEQSNFDDFPIVRMDDMPQTEVHIVPSADPPTGIGEVAVPPIAPAVANGIYAATGKRIRKLPIFPEDIRA
jgi:isoquinoline 1-oxidoreductase beta subunit